nr:DUF3168 domain-containing protein [Sedimentitalea sp. CY04]
MIADPDVAALVGSRVVDQPRENIEFPYIRFGQIEWRGDDTDHTRGALVQVGLKIHSRPKAGKVEALRICETVAQALHLKPEAMTVEGFNVVEVEVQTWFVKRASDGVSYEGHMALQVQLDS